MPIVPPLPPQQQSRAVPPVTDAPTPASQPAPARGPGSLHGRVAIVTGGESGVGRATCVRLAREGASLAIGYGPDAQADADATADLVTREGQRCLLLPADVQDRACCDRVVRDTVRHYGRLDVLVNTAAYQRLRPSIADIDDAQWERTFRTIVYAAFYLTRASLAYLSRGAAIVNVGSAAGLEGSGQLLDYAAAEGAIHAFTKSLALNLAPRGVRVNAVAPWQAGIPIDRPDPGGLAPVAPEWHPAEPDEIAAAIVYLASEEESGTVTGEVLRLPGGDTPLSPWSAE